MNKKTIFFAAIIGIIILLSYLSKENGKSTTTITTSLINDTQSLIDNCDDSDNGLNFFIIGQCGTYKDSCESTNILQEYVCDPSCISRRFDCSGLKKSIWNDVSKTYEEVNYKCITTESGAYCG